MSKDVNMASRWRTWDIECIDSFLATNPDKSDSGLISAVGKDRGYSKLSLSAITLPKAALLNSKDETKSGRARGRSLKTRALSCEKPGRRPGERGQVASGIGNGLKFLGSEYLYKESFPGLGASKETATAVYHSKTSEKPPSHLPSKTASKTSLPRVPVWPAPKTGLSSSKLAPTSHSQGLQIGSHQWVKPSKDKPGFWVPKDQSEHTTKVNSCKNLAGPNSSNSLKTRSQEGVKASNSKPGFWTASFRGVSQVNNQDNVKGSCVRSSMEKDEKKSKEASEKQSSRSAIVAKDNMTTGSRQFRGGVRSSENDSQNKPLDKVRESIFGALNTLDRTDAREQLKTVVQDESSVSKRKLDGNNSTDSVTKPYVDEKQFHEEQSKPHVASGMVSVNNVTVGETMRYEKEQSSTNVASDTVSMNNVSKPHKAQTIKDDKEQSRLASDTVPLSSTSKPATLQNSCESRKDIKKESSIVISNTAMTTIPTKAFLDTSAVQNAKPSNSSCESSVPMDTFVDAPVTPDHANNPNESNPDDDLLDVDTKKALHVDSILSVDVDIASIHTKTTHLEIDQSLIDTAQETSLNNGAVSSEHPDSSNINVDFHPDGQCPLEERDSFDHDLCSPGTDIHPVSSKSLQNVYQKGSTQFPQDGCCEPYEIIPDNNKPILVGQTEVMTKNYDQEPTTQRSACDSEHAPCNTQDTTDQSNDNCLIDALKALSIEDFSETEDVASLTNGHNSENIPDITTAISYNIAQSISMKSNSKTPDNKDELEQENSVHLQNELEESNSEICDEPCDVLLENLPLTITDEDVLEIIEPYGTAISLNFIEEYDSKTCVVRMSDSVCGEWLVVSLDGLEIDGQRMQTKLDI